MTDIAMIRKEFQKLIPEKKIRVVFNAISTEKADVYGLIGENSKGIFAIGLKYPDGNLQIIA